MLKPENQVDKQRFENRKAAKLDRGSGEQDAIESAAEEVKDARRREGRLKESGRPHDSGQ